MSLNLRFPVRLLAALLCAGALCVAASASEPEQTQLTGICVTGTADGTVYLGSRAIRPGDVLTAEQAARLTAASDGARLRYIPVFGSSLAPETTLVLGNAAKSNQVPIAQDSALETYKNLPNEGLLQVSDPEGQTMTYTLVRGPKRGEVIVREDGSFLYTPKHNKVGTDSFTYTATDSLGGVSREATVTVTVLRPTDSHRYTDTAQSGCVFEAEWLRCAGVFSGETVNGQSCFCPEREMSRGQFLAMLMQVLALPVDRSATETGFCDGCESWLVPYLSAANRAGIAAGYACDQGIEFRPDQTVTAGEAADMIQAALRCAVPTSTTAIRAAQSDTPLSRADTARILYRVSKLRRWSI